MALGFRMKHTKSRYEITYCAEYGSPSYSSWNQTRKNACEEWNVIDGLAEGGWNFVSLLDPAMDIDDQMMNFFEYPIAVANQETSIYYAMEKYVDKTGSGMMARFSNEDRFTDKMETTTKFSATVVNVPKLAFLGPEQPEPGYYTTTTTTWAMPAGGQTIKRERTLTYRDDFSSTIFVLPAGNTYRSISTRYKNFFEIWAEVGAAWVSSLLVVSIFFSTKLAVVKDVTEEVRILRVRWPSNQKELARKAATLLKELEDLEGCKQEQEQNQETAD